VLASCLAVGSIAALPALSGAAPHHAAPNRAAHHRESHSFSGTPTVGALFLPGFYPALHTCTASVVRSKHHNLIVTAAHCIQQGDGSGYMFVPGYNADKPRYGVWQTTAVFGAAKWRHQRHGSTQRDWAFLRVAPRTAHGHLVQLQDVVGGNRLGVAPKPKTKVRVPGYTVGMFDQPITCRAPVYRHQGFPAFDCGGYQGGVSGSPWLVGHGKVRIVVGIIGGLHQGGCSPATSYSSRLGKAIHSVRHRAEHHRKGDAFPAAPGDGC
jgi:hypothetical protein